MYFRFRFGEAHDISDSVAVNLNDVVIHTAFMLAEELFHLSMDQTHVLYSSFSLKDNC